MRVNTRYINSTRGTFSARTHLVFTRMPGERYRWEGVEGCVEMYTLCGDVHVGVEGEGWVEMYTLGWRCTRWGGGAGLGGDVHARVE